MKKLYILILIIILSLNFNSGTQNKYKLIPITDNIKNPWGVAILDDNEFLITTKPGKLIHVKNNIKNEYDVSKKIPIFNYGQGGLLDITKSPNYEKNKEIFISFSMKYKNGGITAVAKNRFDNGILGDWKIIFKGNNYSKNGFHFGSRLAIDNDNYLYISIGDRRDREKVQNINYHNGKTIRITTNGKPVPSNPFYYSSNGLKDIYSFGHRNSQGMVFDYNNNILWQNEHGPKGGDEINQIQIGRNYGWPIITYGKEYSGKDIGKGLTSQKGMEQPFINWTPSIAPSGLTYYYNDKFPELKDTLISGALVGKHLRIVYLNEEKYKKQKLLFEGFNRIRDVRTDSNGNIYVLTDGIDGRLYYMSY